MKLCHRDSENGVGRVHGVLGFAGACVLALSVSGALGGLGGCAADEPVGHTKTETKKTIETPTEKTTVKEKHEKETKVIPK